VLCIRERIENTMQYSTSTYSSNYFSTSDRSLDYGSYNLDGLKSSPKSHIKVRFLSHGKVKANVSGIVVSERTDDGDCSIKEQFPVIVLVANFEGVSKIYSTVRSNGVVQHDVFTLDGIMMIELLGRIPLYKAQTYLVEICKTKGIKTGGWRFLLADWPSPQEGVAA